MNDQPAPNDLTLTRDEHPVCVVYTVLWSCGVALAAMAPLISLNLIHGMARWVFRQIEPLLKGELPAFSTEQIGQIIVAGFLIGAAILGAMHFAYLVKFGRWLRPVTLWFWTMLHALLPMLLVLLIAVDDLLKFVRTGRSALPADIYLLFVFLIGMSLPSFYISLGLWRRRKSAGAEWRLVHDRAMSDDETLTPAERKLCRRLLVLAGAGGVVLGYHWELVAAVIASFFSEWVGESWSALRGGKPPPLDSLHLLIGALVSGLLGALFLTSQYLAQLIGWGRWLRLRTLWFWTTLYGGFATALVLIGAPEIPSPMFVMYLLLFAVVCLSFGGAAWLERREKSARAE